MHSISMHSPDPYASVSTMLPHDTSAVQYSTVQLMVVRVSNLMHETPVQAFGSCHCTTKSCTVLYCTALVTCGSMVEPSTLTVGTTWFPHLHCSFYQLVLHMWLQLRASTRCTDVRWHLLLRLARCADFTAAVRTTRGSNTSICQHHAGTYRSLHSRTA